MDLKVPTAAWNLSDLRRQHACCMCKLEELVGDAIETMYRHGRKNQLVMFFSDVLDSHLPVSGICSNE